MNIIDKFNKRIQVTPSCWIWKGYTNGRYGKFYSVSSNVYAHRFSYETYVGEIPIGYVICHRCDNPLCVNPDHLFAATQLENIADCVNKGRQAKGEHKGNSILSELQVLEIRKLYVKGSSTFGIVNLASIFGVGKSQIQRIVKNKQWSHL
jgi:hypothetical protein